MKKLLDIFIKKGAEKVILLAAILIFMTYFVLGFILGGKDKGLDELNQRAQKLKAAVESATKTGTENFTSTYSATLAMWNEIPSFTEGSGWISYKPPTIIRKEKVEVKKNVVVQKPLALSTPRIKNITAKIGNIFIEWENISPSPAYREELPSSYKIERRAENTKEYKTISTLTATTYTDINIQPKTTYYYRIVALSDKLNTEKVSEESAIKSKGVFAITFKGTMGNAAVIDVRKFEASRQTEFEKVFFVKREQKIGEKGQKIPDKSKKGANVTIDFDTGYVAENWGEEKVKVTDLVCVNPTDENHKPEMVATEVKEQYFIYKNDEGKEKKIWRNDKEPQGVDRRCPKHKDKKVEAPQKQKDSKKPKEADNKPK